MEVGGAERALLGLLNALDTERVDVDLFINQHTGEFMDMIPKNIRLIPENICYSVIRKPIIDTIKKRQFKIAFLRLLARYEYKRDVSRRQIEGCSNHYVMRRIIKQLPSLYYLGEYDLALSFIDPSHVIHEKVLARKRLEWLHTDFSVFNMDEDCVAKTWGRDDYIVAVSQDIAERFKEKYPQFAHKVIVLENILSPETVCQESINGVAPEMDNCGETFKILSIGRICYAKYFERIPDIAAIIKREGLRFEWFIVGPGNATSIMQHAIELGVENQIHFVGKKDNPYPYIKACDLYVQCSRREGKSVTVREAQILCKPVVITRYPTSGSQIKDGQDGIICDMDNESVAQAILAIIQDEEKRQQIINYLESHDYGNQREVEKIYELLVTSGVSR